MKILPTGDLGVAPGELIKIRIAKSRIPFAAAVSDLIGATWETTGRPDVLTEVRTFHAPTALGAQVFSRIALDFVPNDEGAFDPEDEYIVEIKGDSGDTSTIVLSAVEAPLTTVEFVFQVTESAGPK